MISSKTLVIVLIALTVGFGAGFIARPVVAPIRSTAVAAEPAQIAPMSAAARGTQYFAAHLDEARRIVAGCEDGAVRGDECANAQNAIIAAEARERQRRFLGN